MNELLSTPHRNQMPPCADEHLPLCCVHFKLLMMKSANNTMTFATFAKNAISDCAFHHHQQSSRPEDRNSSAHGFAFDTGQSNYAINKIKALDGAKIERTKIKE